MSPSSRKRPSKKKPSRLKDGRTPRAQPPQSHARYTPPLTPTIRFRPVWHKAVGAAQILLGLALVVLNFFQHGDAQYLPGGHNEGYFIVGAAVAAAASWWFGAFDRPG